MIETSAGVRSAVETEVEKAYESLSTYARSDKANPKAVAVRKRMLDIFSDGWNAQEARIEELETQVEILTRRLKYEEMPKPITLERPATWLDVISLHSTAWKEALANTDARKEAYRAQHLLQVQQRWADHF